MEYLECSLCRQNFQAETSFPFCPNCRNPLLFPVIKEKKQFNFRKSTSLEIFQQFLPLPEIIPDLLLGEGFTPLVNLNNIKKIFNLPFLYAKNESQNPTGTFKDRGSAVAVQNAFLKRKKRIGTVSVGNMASSTAAYGARAGLETILLVKEDTPQEKLHALTVFKPVVIQVKGDYGELFEQSYNLGRNHDICFINSVDPYRIEGYKLEAYEIYLQLGHKVPSHMVVPVSSGGHLIGLMKAFFELHHQGLGEKIPEFIAVQAKQISPLAEAFDKGQPTFKRISKPPSIPYAISNPNPPGGNIVLNWIYKNNGKIVAVSDDEIKKAQKMLAEEEGLYVLPSSAASLAGLIKAAPLLSKTEDNLICLVLTGTGLKGKALFMGEGDKILSSSIKALEKTLSELTP